MDLKAEVADKGDKKMNNRFEVFATLLALLLPVTALATDGAFEINQACVANGCFPGDTGGFPVTLANEGNYVLTSNLVLSTNAQTAIQVNSDNVNIDMQGFGIFGVNQCTGMQDDCTFSGGGAGIESADTRRNIVVRNGIIRGMGHAAVNIGEQSIVENIIAEHNWRVGIFVRAGSTVRDSNSNFNGFLGIEAHESRLIDCSVADNGQVGFAVNRSIVVHGVAVRTANQTGILDGYGSQIHDSLTRDNPTGIESINGATSVFGSTIIANTGVGIFARGDTGADPIGMPILLSGNTIVLNNGGNDNVQLGGSGTFVELATNYCGRNTTCP